MASPPLNTDAVTEILSRLPVQSLARFRAASKFWRDVIDCPSFRKSQIANYKDKDEDYASSILLFKYFRDPTPSKLLSESSIIFRDTGKSLDLPALGKFVIGLDAVSRVRVVGPVAGLICIHNWTPNTDIAVCNPFLDELKILPFHSICSHAHHTDAGISYDDVVDDYKVVKLAPCTVHGIHASIYSKNMNSWRELAGGGGEFLLIHEPIQSSCSNGGVAHWRATRLVGEFWKDVILSFDMKTEMFRRFEMMEADRGRCVNVYEKGGTFVLIALDSWYLYMYEGRFEGDNRVAWHRLKRVGVMGGFCDLFWRSGRVVFYEKEPVFKRSCKKLILYDYCGEKIVGHVERPSDCRGLDVFEYNGSFVSP